MATDESFVQRVGQELVAHLTEADIELCAFNIDAPDLTLTIPSADDLAILSDLTATLELWLDQRGATIDAMSSATRNPSGTISINFTLGRRTDLPAVHSTTD